MYKNNLLVKNRYAIKIAYDGTKFNGWQIQRNTITVQQVLEDALSLLLKEKIRIIGAGRTDTGVHATGQFAHFDTNNYLKDNFLNKINGILPNSIAVLEVFKTIPNFHARFDALYRKYIYKITTQKNPFLLERSLFIPYPLNFENMQLASKELLKFDDFKAFCKAHSNNKTYLCKVNQAEWKIYEQNIEFHIQANRFLRGMVRAIVGTLLEVGKEKISVNDFISIIRSGDRKKAKMNVAPYGLYLVEVGYPQEFFIIENEN